MNYWLWIAYLTSLSAIVAHDMTYFQNCCFVFEINHLMWWLFLSIVRRTELRPASGSFPGAVRHDYHRQLPGRWYSWTASHHAGERRSCVPPRRWEESIRPITQARGDHAPYHAGERRSCLPCPTLNLSVTLHRPSVAASDTILLCHVTSSVRSS